MRSPPSNALIRVLETIKSHYSIDGFLQKLSKPQFESNIKAIFKHSEKSSAKSIHKEKKQEKQKEEIVSDKPH